MRDAVNELAGPNKGMREGDLRLFGVYVGRVAEITDPEGRGRVRVTMPAGAELSRGLDAWARLATLFAGDARGSWFRPEVEDEVLVAFEAGDARRPFVVGSLWKAGDRMPVSASTGGNEKKVIRSRNGVQVMLVDQDGQDQILLETPGGQKITLRDGPGSVELEDSNGNQVTLEASGVTIGSAAKVTINAGQLEISAGALTVNAGMAKFSGVVQADTVITNSVVSASYTPGAGNIW